ncbi:MAG TPA: lysylphosphatidylglycerol synthase domain-containing protein [Thermoleophilaceae bacterium]|nr:lysylphosphatidylglycerol synthase domain-containing protein [Thermoleophilaceae bacterium]
MRVGLVSPYSYTYPGGVGRHVEALAEELLRQGHDVRLFAPYDPDDRLARVLHRGARPQRRRLSDYVVPLGRTIGIPANGAVSNLNFTPGAVSILGRAVRDGGFDVVHVHEPNAPVLSWVAVEESRPPVVGTFHSYSTGRLANGIPANVLAARRLYRKLYGRIAVSEAAAWTARRFYGGRYQVIPNGVDLAAARPTKRDGGELTLLFVGRTDPRKGLPVLLRAFEALRGAGVAARLVVAGPAREEVNPLLLDPDGVEVAGRVSDDEKWRLLGEADILSAPSLGGESFGMVITEAFASGTPVVASDIAGYRDVVRDRVDGMLVPAGEPVELAETLRALALDPARRQAMSVAAQERAERFAWPRVAREVTEVYEQALALPRPEGRVRSAAARAGLLAAEPGAAERPRRLPSLEPRVRPERSRRRITRRVGLVSGAAAAAGLGALALDRIGLGLIGHAVLAATPVWVLVSLVVMSLAMLVRAEAWHAILRAALPGTPVRRRDAVRGTMIGVLMSATLPARLGEPSRALIVARRLGRMRDRFPVVLGTLVSQTLLNILALGALGSVMFATVGLFRGNEDALVIGTMVPVVLLVLMLASPWLLGQRRSPPSGHLRQAVAIARRTMVEVRRGLQVFRNPRLGAWALVVQLSAWGLQWMACYALLIALGLDDRAGLGAAAAVLFAVNVTAALPATPSNLGVFQAACVAVLSAYGVGKADALAYGIILQAVEICTALVLGMPALLREGMTWRDMRTRVLHAAPVRLARTRRPPDAAELEA